MPFKLFSLFYHTYELLVLHLSKSTVMVGVLIRLVFIMFHNQWNQILLLTEISCSLSNYPLIIVVSSKNPPKLLEMYLNELHNIAAVIRYHPSHTCTYNLCQPGIKINVCTGDCPDDVDIMLSGNMGNMTQTWIIWNWNFLSKTLLKMLSDLYSN